MNYKFLSLVFILVFSLKNIQAQTDTTFWNKEMIKIATPTSSPGWINIKPDVLIAPSTFFAREKQTLGLGNNDSMRLDKTIVDRLGMSHSRYQQFYKGYKVMYGEFFLHARQEQLLTANGKMVRGLSIKPLINISIVAALKNAMKFFPASPYAWEVPQLENNYKEILHDQNATYKPIGELVWVSPDEPGDTRNTSDYELAYMFDLYSTSLDGKRIFINAKNGMVIKSLPLTPDCDATSVTTNFYGPQGFSTRLIPGSSPARWNLWNDCRPAFIRVQKWAANSVFTDYISNAGNAWSFFPSEATSLWCMEKAYDYYFNTFNRNGWNNAGGGVYILQDALFGCTPPPNPCLNGQNASFSNGTMLVGNADNSNPIDDYNTLDIIAHEFTHGVTSSSFANLIYSKESGALNESFSDILGVTCYNWIFGFTGNMWKLGFDRKNPNNGTTSLYLRNMANPNDASALTPSPDTYLSDPLWVSTTTPTDVGNDNWGVHTNSGVQNYMFYLLTSGGSGTNNNGTPFSLIGIGIVAAREIAYRALTIGYLFSTSGFAQARTAWVHAAVDLYGECSLQAIETGKAWDAVGLPPPQNNIYSNICGDYGGTVFTLTNPNNFTLSQGCLMNVWPSSLVAFGARSVILKPGFNAKNGSRFRAYVSDCRYAAY